MLRNLDVVLLKEIDPKHTVVKPFDGFIFVCGGPIPHRVEGATLASIRQFALGRVDAHHKLASREVIVAEKATDLLVGDSFSDLLEFEEHLAALSACVLIFLESAGSLAELGSFAVMPNLLKKVLVVCEHRHSIPANSFIMLGPIASLRKNDKKSVQVFPMHVGDLRNLTPSEDLINECWSDIEKALAEFVERPVSESAFDRKSLPHRMILFVELVSLFRALRKSELKDCAETFTGPLANKEIDRCLNLLVSFRMIAVQEWGNDTFYVRRSTEQYMRHRRVDSRPFDRIRFAFDRIEEYRRQDERKSKALRAHSRSLTQT